MWKKSWWQKKIKQKSNFYMYPELSWKFEGNPLTNKKVTGFLQKGSFFLQKSGFTLEICSQPREAIHLYTISNGHYWQYNTYISARQNVCPGVSQTWNRSSASLYTDINSPKHRGRPLWENREDWSWGDCHRIIDYREPVGGHVGIIICRPNCIQL